MVPGARGPSEGSLNERGEEEKEEKEGEEEVAIENVESDTACSLWEQTIKTKVRETDIDQSKQIVSRQQHSVTSSSTGTH